MSPILIEVTCYDIKLKEAGAYPRWMWIIENLDSANVELTDTEFTELEEALNELKVYDHRGLGGF